MFISGFPSEWSTLKKLMWLRLLNGGGGSAITLGPAPIVSFNSTKASPMRKLMVDFSPVQDLHGYDSPWPAGGGANKFDKDAASIGKWLNVNTGAEESTTNKYALSDWIPVEANKTYTFTQPNSSRRWLYDANKQPLQIISGGLSAYPTEDGYVRLTVGLDDSPLDTMMFVEGNALPQTYSPYSNLCPISGWDGVTVYDDPLYAGVIEWNQTIQNGNFANGYTGWGAQGLAYSAADNAVTFTWTTNTNHVYWQDNISFTVGHKYLLSFRYKDNGTHVRITPRLGSTTTFTTRVDATGDNVWHEWAEMKNLDSAPNLNRVSFYIAELDVDDTFSVTGVMLFDLTEMFGAGNEPATEEEFKALFPKDYYPYNAGTETLVGTVNGMETRSVTVTIGQTVYGGTIDVVSGVGEIDKYGVRAKEWLSTTPSVTVKNGYTEGRINYTGPAADNAKANRAICNVLKYASTGDKERFAGYNNLIFFNLAGEMTLAEWKAKIEAIDPFVAFLIATPIPIQLTPQEVKQLVGENHVWSSAGDVTVEVVNATPIE